MQGVLTIVSLAFAAWAASLLLRAREAVRRLKAEEPQAAAPRCSKCQGLVANVCGPDRVLQINEVLHVELSQYLVLPECIECGKLDESDPVVGILRSKYETRTS